MDPNNPGKFSLELNQEMECHDRATGSTKLYLKLKAVRFCWLNYVMLCIPIAIIMLQYVYFI